MSGELLSMTLAGGETKTFQKAGRYFEIIADGGSTFNLTFYGDGGAIQSNVNGAQAGLFLEDPWNAFTITNNSAAAQMITMLVMDSGRGGTRRQPGVVSVVDAGKTRTLAGQAFIARYANSVGAATFACVQLYNPAASGVRCVVESITMQCTVAGQLFATIQPANLTGATHATSKLSGGTASKAFLQASSAAAFASLDVAAADVLQLANAANTAITYTFKEPIVLLPGYGLMVISDQNASPTVAATWEFFEESLTGA